MAASLGARLRHLADRVDVAKVLAPIRLDDDGGFDRGRIFAFPEEEFLSIALETDLDEHFDQGAIGGVDVGRGTWEEPY